MEQHDFINLYIKHLVKEVEELTKTKIILNAKEEFKSAEADELHKKLTDLEERSGVEKDDVAKTWQLALTEKDSEVDKLQHELSDLRRKLQVETERSTGLETKIEVITKDAKNAEVKHEETLKQLKAKEVEREETIKQSKAKEESNSKETPQKKKLKSPGATLLHD